MIYIKEYNIYNDIDDICNEYGIENYTISLNLLAFQPLLENLLMMLIYYYNNQNLHQIQRLLK